MVIAADRRQARVVLRYVRGLLAAPVLGKLVVNDTAESIELAGNTIIEVGTASHSIRGYTIAAALATRSPSGQRRTARRRTWKSWLRSGGDGDDPPLDADRRVLALWSVWRLVGRLSSQLRRRRSINPRLSCADGPPAPAPWRLSGPGRPPAGTLRPWRHSLRPNTRGAPRSGALTRARRDHDLSSATTSSGCFIADAG